MTDSLLDMVPTIKEDDRLKFRRFILAGVTIFVVLPLSLVKDLSFLKYSSLVANLALLYVIGILFFKNAPETDVTYVRQNWDVIFFIFISGIN